MAIIVLLILFANTSTPGVYKKIEIWGGQTREGESDMSPREAVTHPTVRILLRL